jgi:ABC-type molybdate transport system ATPase subunit
LKIIAGLLTPSQGEVLVNGTAIHTLRERVRHRFRACPIGYVFQRSTCYPLAKMWRHISQHPKLHFVQSPEASCLHIPHLLYSATPSTSGTRRPDRTSLPCWWEEGWRRSRRGDEGLS